MQEITETCGILYPILWPMLLCLSADPAPGCAGLQNCVRVEPTTHSLEGRIPPNIQNIYVYPVSDFLCFSQFYNTYV
jgi:hypothetical protein